MQTVSEAQKIEYTTELNVYIEDFFTLQIKKAAEISPYYEALWQEISRLIHAGGKRLRPRLTILAYQALGGNDVKSILPIAVAQEFIHLAMLIHDDIIDRDDVRYGVDNISGSFKKIYKQYVSNEQDRKHYADSAAILAGDLMLSSAYQLIAEANVDAQTILEVQRIFGRGIFEVVGGEFIDTESAFRELGDIRSEAVARYKTASYTFMVPMTVGALLAGASKADQAYIKEFAENIGIAFQLQDDIIGVFGNEAVTGKSTTGDIREGKRTFMIEQFYELASEDQSQTFHEFFGNQNVTANDAENVRSLLVESGAKQKTELAIAAYEKRARAAIENVELAEAAKNMLEEFILIATKRVK